MTMPTIRTLSRDGTLKRGDTGLAARIEHIFEEPGFNDLARDNDEDLQQSIDELEAFLTAGGVVPPLRVRPRAEGGVWLVDGHRRYRALKQMDAKGTLPRTPNKEDKKILEAWVDIIPFTGNDAERILFLATSNKNKSVNALGLGRIYNKLLAMKWTVQQIAERSGEQVATIKRILDLANGNTDVHEQVKAGTVSPTIAAAAVRKHGDKAGEVLATQLEQAKAAGKKKVTAAVTKLTFDQWFEDWKVCQLQEGAEGYRETFRVVWTAARAGK